MRKNYKKFALWVVDCLFDDTMTFDALHECAFGELAFRKLEKLGLVKQSKDGEYWEKENARD